MGHLPEYLDNKILKRLEAKDKIIYFNYIPPYMDISFLDEDEIEFLSKGDSYALIGNDLYVKFFSNPKPKILELKSLELKIDYEKGHSLIADCIYAPAGREYKLIQRNLMPRESDYLKNLKNSGIWTK